jgi:hypothetical protein
MSRKPHASDFADPQWRLLPRRLPPVRPGRAQRCCAKWPTPSSTSTASAAAGELRSLISRLGGPPTSASSAGSTMGPGTKSMAISSGTCVAIGSPPRATTASFGGQTVKATEAADKRSCDSAKKDTRPQAPYHGGQAELVVGGPGHERGGRRCCRGAASVGPRHGMVFAAFGADIGGMAATTRARPPRARPCSKSVLFMAGLGAANRTEIRTIALPQAAGTEGRLTAP